MKIIRYFFVGGTAALVDISVFGLLAKGMGLPWFPVAVFSFTLATIVNYILSVAHVFKSGSSFAKHHEILLVFIVSAVGLLVNQTILWLLIEIYAWNLMLAKIFATGSVFFWNYTMRRQFIFREKPDVS